MKKKSFIRVAASILCSLMLVFTLTSCNNDNTALSSATEAEDVATTIAQESLISTEAEIQSSSSEEQQTEEIASEELTAESVESAEEATRSAADNTTAPERTTASTTATPATTKAEQPPEPASSAHAEQPTEPSLVPTSKDNNNEPSQSISDDKSEDPTETSEASTPEAPKETNNCNVNGHKWGEWTVVRDEDATQTKSSFIDGRWMADVCGVTFHRHTDERICSVCGESDYKGSCIVTDLWTNPHLYPNAEQSVKDWYERFYIGMDIIAE